MCVSGDKKCYFFGKFGVLCILETPVLRFALLVYYRRTLIVLFEDKLMSNFKKKAELFNSHFAAQCTVVNNTSALPDLQLRTNHWLNDFTINEEYVLVIIKNFNSNKAHGWDKIFIRVIQLCGKSIVFPLKLFKSVLEEDIFPEGWK